MKLLLLKILLQRRAKDEGFTLPMVIALGLIMILLGAVNITVANEENLTAITQNSTSDALAIAEVGVARYRELLDRNRILTLYDANATTNSWNGLLANAEFCDGDIANFFPGTTNNVTISEDGQVLDNDSNSNETFALGNYSLVSYSYNNADGDLDLTDDALNGNATGELVVRGTATDANGNPLGSAQIKVDIPIRINQDDMNNLAPALWIGDDTITQAELGNLTIGAGSNIVLQDSAVATGTVSDGCGDFATLRTATGLPIISDPRNIPSIQKVTDEFEEVRNIVDGGDQTNDLPVAATPPGAPRPRIVLGSLSDEPYNPESDRNNFDREPYDLDSNTLDCRNIQDCRYYYDPNVLAVANVDLLTDGVAKSSILVNGTVSITSVTENVNIGSTSRFSSSDALEIYVMGNNAITINVNAGRTVTIDAFINAPNSTLTITGGGIVNINGSVWVNDFINTSATVNISPDDSNLSSTVSNRAYEFYTTTSGRTPRPITASPTNWKTEEIPN